MGTGGSKVKPSKEQIYKNKQIEVDIRKQIGIAEKSLKLLLLGAGESGKSTVLKQMRILHTTGFSPAEIEEQAFVIRENLIKSMITIVQAMAWLEVDLRDPSLEKDLLMVEAVSAQTRTFVTLETSKLLTALKRLWKDQGVQECYNRRNEYQLIDSAKYYLDDIDRLAASNYKPTVDDMLRSRTKTIGITEVQFEMDSLLFRVMDVGGQRSERRKWIKCFDGVNSILFIAAISEYNLVLEEDSETNRMVESLNLFDSICNNVIFEETSIILFLNKIDLFEEKIKQFPLKIAFPDFEESNDVEACKEKIRDAYLERNRTPARDIYAHFTCATDTKQISFILESTMNNMVKERMKDSGLM